MPKSKCDKHLKNKIEICETYAVGVTPASLAVTPNNRYAYVVNSNNYEIAGSDTVTVLDLKNGVPKLTISHPSFDEPYRVAIDREGRYAYVTNSDSPKVVGGTGTVSVIDIASNQVVDVINGFDGPSGITIHKSTAYVTNYGAPGGLKSGFGKTISVVDLNTRKITATIEVDLAPASVIVSPDHKFLYVICYTTGMPGTGILDIIDRRTLTIVNRIPGLFGSFGIVASPNGKYVYVTNFGSNDFAPYGNTVSVIDLRLGRIVKNIEVGIQPSGIAIDPKGKYLYVSNYNSLYAGPGFQNLTYGEGLINIICLKKHVLVPPAISIGSTPSTLIMADDGKKLYVCKYAQNTVSTICLD